jgi:hypothetical protein
LKRILIEFTVSYNCRFVEQHHAVWARAKHLARSRFVAFVAIMLTLVTLLVDPKKQQKSENRKGS